MKTDRAAQTTLGRGGYLFWRLHQFDFQIEGNFVTHQPTARFQRHIPVQAPILAVDLSVRIEASTGAAKRVLHNSDQRGL